MEPRDLLPAKPPSLPLPQALVDYLNKVISPKPEKIYSVGDTVYHWRFGQGIIREHKYASYGRWLVVIEFSDPQYGTKTFFAEVPYLSKEDISRLTLQK